MLFFTWTFPLDFWSEGLRMGANRNWDTSHAIPPGRRSSGPARLAMPIGAFLLILQGHPELFRAFHQMGKEREAIFPADPADSISSFWLIMFGVFFQRRSLPFDDLVDSILHSPGSGLFNFDKPTSV